MSHDEERAAPERASSAPLPSELRREIKKGAIEDPLWYVGRLGTTVEDALDATEDESRQMQAELGRPPEIGGDANGNGYVDDGVRGTGAPAEDGAANGRATDGNGTGRRRRRLSPVGGHPRG